MRHNASHKVEPETPDGTASALTKPCSTCGSEIPLDEFEILKGGQRRGQCTPCYRNKRAAYRTANKEKTRLWGIAYRAGHKGQIRTTGILDRLNNQAKVKAIAAASRDRNRDKRREGDKEYKKKHQAKVKSAQSEYAKANREMWRAYAAARRARKRTVSGSFTGEDIKRLIVLQKNKCALAWCGTSLVGGYHIDHIKPLILGGGNDKRNIQLLCPTCNQSKGPKHPVDFALRNGMLV